VNGWTHPGPTYQSAQVHWRRPPPAVLCTIVTARSYQRQEWLHKWIVALMLSIVQLDLLLQATCTQCVLVFAEVACCLRLLTPSYILYVHQLWQEIAGNYVSNDWKWSETLRQLGILAVLQQCTGCSSGSVTCEPDFLRTLSSNMSGWSVTSKTRGSALLCVV